MTFLWGRLNEQLGEEIILFPSRAAFALLFCWLKIEWIKYRRIIKWLKRRRRRSDASLNSAAEDLYQQSSEGRDTLARPLPAHRSRSQASGVAAPCGPMNGAEPLVSVPDDHRGRSGTGGSWKTRTGSPFS